MMVHGSVCNVPFLGKRFFMYIGQFDDIVIILSFVFWITFNTTYFHVPHNATFLIFLPVC